MHVVALGPGLSRDPETAELTRRLVAKVETPMVVDADGLNAFEARSAEIAAAAGPRILTPHIGEMARLTGVGAEELERTRIDAALEWAQRWRAIVVPEGRAHRDRFARRRGDNQSYRQSRAWRPRAWATCSPA